MKSITNHDAVSPTNNIVRTYEYRSQAYPARSSGAMYSKPVYAYSHTAVAGLCLDEPQGQNASFAMFSEMGIVPLGSYEGAHIGYDRVRENLNGNGYSVYLFATEAPNYPYPGASPPPSDLAMYQFPVAPALPRVDAGSQVNSAQYDSGGNAKALENIIAAVPTNYTTIGDVCIKAFKASGNLEVWSKYSNRTKPAFRKQTVETMQDGVYTTRSYEYSSPNHFFPTAEVLTNSDNVQTRTEYLYSHDYPTTAIKNDLVGRNMLQPAWKTTIKVAGTEVDGSELEYSFFHNTSGAQQSTATGAFPRIWKFYDYEKTWDAAGTLTGTGKTLKATIDDYDGATGKPRTFTQAGWQPEQYTWNSAGLITKRSFNYNDASPYKRFETNYEYHNGTRLLKKITSVDGQFMEYTYDGLQRLDSIKMRKVGNVYNTVTKYTYQFKNATYPRSFVKTESTFTATAGSGLTNKTVFQYLDGLGRPVQTVDMKHSPAQRDVVSSFTYDNQGRQDTSYVVFEKTAVPYNNGAFIATIPSGTKFTLKQYEASPLNRTVSVTPPSWYATTYAYGANTAAEAVIMTQGASPVNFAANLLAKTTVTDPNGNKSISFTDKKGRLILSRRTDANGTSTANTYNLYDNKDRLVKVLPPGVGVAVADTNLIFHYRYDQADNMVYKNVPDAAPMAMQYDARNLMTLMQDGNLLAQGKWLGTKYDIYGMPVKTGFTTSSNPSTFTISAADLLTQTYYNDTIAQAAIYKGKVRQTNVRVLDGGTTFVTTNYSYDAHGRLSGTTANNFTGGSDNYTFAYDWADNRLTSNRTHKRLSTDATTNIVEKTTYNHAGRVSTNKHNLNYAPSDMTLSSLAYDYKDQLAIKYIGLGDCGTGSSFAGASAASPCWLQTLDYAYNDQGWLTTINQASLGGGSVALAACPTVPTAPSPTITDDNDLFYLELKYDGQFTGMTGDTLQKNGNINQMMWRTRGRERQAYNFSYDYLDRLRSAVYADVNDAGTVTANNRFNESLSYADARGNISNLKRVGGKINGTCWEFGQIDNLTYSYTTGTNRISTIADAAAAVWKDKGFKDGSTGSYAYDPNGNLTSDPDKGMVVQYNHLNLPKKFTFGTNTIDILYDASGNKLRKTVAGTTNYTQDYIGGIEYRGTAREAIYTAEGRVFYTSPTATRYEYSIKDHLGNTRISFTDKNNNGYVDFATEVLQENHYYPFGLNTEGPWMNDAALDNRYQYNGKEFNDDFGLNWLDFKKRWYDPTINRFPSVDPIISSFPYLTPYNYASDNPIKNIDLWGLQGLFFGFNMEFMSSSSTWLETPLLENTNPIIARPPVVEQAVECAEACAESSNSAPRFSPEQLDNFKRGNASEAEQLAKNGLEKNTKPLKTEVEGKEVKTIPDALKNDGQSTVEIKNVKQQSLTKQLKAQEKISTDNGFKPELIINEGAKLSKPLQNSNFKITTYGTVPLVTTDNTAVKTVLPVNVEQKK